MPASIVPPVLLTIVLLSASVASLAAPSVPVLVTLLEIDGKLA